MLIGKERKKIKKEKGETARGIFSPDPEQKYSIGSAMLEFSQLLGAIKSSFKG
jgi:hypothetical protein